MGLLSILGWEWCWAVSVHVRIVSAHAGHEGAIRRIMEVLGFLAHTVHAMSLETALDAAVAWSLVTCDSPSDAKEERRKEKGKQAERDTVKSFTSRFVLVLTTCQMGALAGKSGPSSLLPSGS